MSDPVEVRYLSNRQVEEIVIGLLRRFEVYDTVPIPIEKIVELKLELNIVPFPNLYTTFGINSFIEGDLSSISIDQHLLDKLPLQRNFTLAHELGHLFLHDHIYKENRFTKLDGYKKFIRNFSPVEYSVLESQAHEFAGRFMVPSHQLEFYFDQEKKGLDGMLKRLANRAEKIDIISTVIAERLSPIFEVHRLPIKIRIKKAGLVTRHFKL